MFIDVAKYKIKAISNSSVKELVFVLLLSLNFIISFRVFNHTLLQATGKIVETVYLALMFLYILSRIINRIVSNDYRLNGFQLMFSIYLLLPILPAISSQIVWDQPFYLGFVSFRDFYLIGSALLLYNFTIRNIRNLLYIEKAMVFTAWFTLILFFITSTFINPSAFLDSNVVSYSANRGGVLLFKFNMGFIFFGAIYYFVRYFKKRNIFHLIFSLLFLSYIVFERQDRSSMIAVTFVMGFYFFTNVKLKRQVLYILGSIIPIVTIIFIIYLFKPESIESYIFMFEDIFYALSGKANPDVGQSVRIYETQIAQRLIADSPFIGNGKLSNYFIQGGWSGLYIYFYPSDIGLVGSVFVYGFPGAVVLYSQFVFALVWALRVKYFRKNIFFQACCFYLLVLVIDSISNGYLTVFAAQSISTITVIFLFYIYDKKIMREIKNKVENDYSEFA